jgi:hypothetical protein
MSENTIDLSQCTDLNATIKALAGVIPPVVNRDGRQYPFVGEKGVRKVLEVRPDVKIANAVLMYHLQTEYEQAASETKDKNRRGLMSSHAATATKVIASYLAGAGLDEEAEYNDDGFVFNGATAYLTHIGGRYAKQLSVSLRVWAITQEPELGVTASMFSVR